MTPLLQPLDVAVNRPFKTLVSARYTDWMVNGEKTFTAGGNMRSPTLQLLTDWVADSWLELDPKCIINGFKKCCISNALDGTEDDLLWEDDSIPQTAELPAVEDGEEANLYYHDKDILGANMEQLFD